MDRASLAPLVIAVGELRDVYRDVCRESGDGAAHHLVWRWAQTVRLRQGKIVELWPVQETLPLLEGIGAVVAMK
jgi:hypothetical protein